MNPTPQYINPNAEFVANPPSNETAAIILATGVLVLAGVVIGHQLGSGGSLSLGLGPLNVKL